MRKRLLGRLTATALLASTGIALGQSQLPPRLPAVAAVPGQAPEKAPIPKAVAQEAPKKDDAKLPVKKDDGVKGAPGAAPVPMGGVPAPLPGVVMPPTNEAAQAALATANGTCEDKSPPFLYPGRFYTTAEYLMWWTKADKLPTLVTTGPIGTLTTTAALGQSGTQVLYGNSDVDDNLRSGGRFGMGYWFNCDESVGFEASLLLLTQTGSGFGATSTGSPVLARPYVNLDLINRGLQTGNAVNAENALLVAYPAFPGAVSGASGQITVSTTSDVWGIEGNARFNVAGNSTYRADMLLGARHLDVDEQLTIASSSNPARGSIVVFRDPRSGLPNTRTNAQQIGILDKFETRNNFYGGQVGAKIEGRRGRFSGEAVAKLALGVVHQDVDISGVSIFTPRPGTGGSVEAVQGGLLAQTSNIGKHSDDTFGFVPEAGLNVGYWITDHIRATIGYSVIYWRSDVVRPGAEIDRVVNPSLVPTLNTGLNSPQQRPAFQFVDQDFWAQGLNFGLELNF